MQFLLNGLISGLGLSILALAIQVVYLPTRIIFIALAGIYSLAPYLFNLLLKFNIPWGISGLLTLVLCGGIGVGCEWFNHRLISSKQENKSNANNGLPHFISSLGIFIMLQQIVIMVWGNSTQTLSVRSNASVHAGQLMLSVPQCLIAVAGFVVICSFTAILLKTDIGLKMRALVDDPELFLWFGNHVATYRIVCFALSGALAALCAMLNAFDTGFDPFTGMQFLLVALVALTLGGFNSFQGAIVGAVVIGIVRELTVWQFSAAWKDGITFLIFGLILAFRPQGILGKKSRLEANLY